MPLANAQLQMLLRGDLSAAVDLATGVAVHSLMRGSNFTNGTAAGQADMLWSDTRSLGPSAAEDLDLAGSLTNLFGATQNFARVKGLLIASAPGNLNNISFGANVAANAWAALFGPAGASGGTITLKPGDAAMFVAGQANATGWVVTAGTADLLHVVNLAGVNTVSYDIAVMGCSA